jgi:hypothetical protein
MNLWLRLELAASVELAEKGAHKRSQSRSRPNPGAAANRSIRGDIRRGDFAPPRAGLQTGGSLRRPRNCSPTAGRLQRSSEPRGRGGDAVRPWPAARRPPAWARARPPGLVLQRSKRHRR